MKRRIRNGRIYYYTRYQAERHRNIGDRIFYSPEYRGYYIKRKSQIEMYYEETFKDKIMNMLEKIKKNIKEFLKSERSR